jgi:hypothetical protein
MSGSNNFDEIALSPSVGFATQLRTLRTLLLQIEKTRKSGVTPVVEIDLDLTALMPVLRTRRALQRTAQATGIDISVQSDERQILPGYSDEAWVSFVRQMALVSEHPSIKWLTSEGKPNAEPDGPFSIFHRGYWEADLMHEDTPTPGLGSFVHRVLESGGEVVFISGRWLEEHIVPTIRSLKRAGIADPKLVIGNPRHPTLVAPEHALSDAAIKVIHQAEVSKYGQPVAIVDDRISNREAVANHFGGHILKVAVCIPGFTHDPVNASDELRISTFETFDTVVGHPPIRIYMSERYPGLGLGRPWRGTYEGLGLNNKPYVLPRLFSDTSKSSTRETVTRPFLDIIQNLKPGSIQETQLVTLCGSLVPVDFLNRLDKCLSEAEILAKHHIAAPFPQTETEREHLRLSIIVSWLHSHDVEQLMTALGYSIRAKGVHDIDELVSPGEIKASVANARQSGQGYSDWVLNWVDCLDEATPVNVGFLNPALSVGMWRWRPAGAQQDAMDIHRAASHHAGDGLERYDPIEAAVNNVLHQREGTFGIRKENVIGWHRMFQSVQRETEAEAFCKSSVGRQALRDAIQIGAELEALGALTPWGLVVGASFDD